MGDKQSGCRRHGAFLCQPTQAGEGLASHIGLRVCCSPEAAQSCKVGSGTQPSCRHSTDLPQTPACREQQCQESSEAKAARTGPAPAAHSQAAACRLVSLLCWPLRAAAVKATAVCKLVIVSRQSACGR